MRRKSPAFSASRTLDFIIQFRNSTFLLLRKRPGNLEIFLIKVEVNTFDGMVNFNPTSPSDANIPVACLSCRLKPTDYIILHTRKKSGIPPVDVDFGK
jgi:hypothetical protein